MPRAGYYFPHDEFYDAAMRDALFEIARRAKPGTKVASESPLLASYYAERANRPDLVCVSLSESGVLEQLKEGDFIVDARGRRYFSNEELISTLHKLKPAFTVSLGLVPAADVYELDGQAMKVLAGSRQNTKANE